MFGLEILFFYLHVTHLVISGLISKPVVKSSPAAVWSAVCPCVRTQSGKKRQKAVKAALGQTLNLSLALNTQVLGLAVL